MSLRVVLDTNVRISSLITPNGVCARLIAGFEGSGDKQLISDLLLKELQSTLTVRYRWPAARIVSAGQAISAVAEYVLPDVVVETCLDPDDNHVLECALAGAANVIVTGDDDLLTLHPWRGIQIVTVRRFLELYPNLRSNPVP